ncbi:hypothetical protein KFE25_008216 [Diacronema lutheri]|uniref:Uncharacterized protein n=1 Tax=Diacronema lutheri TaxID=2081491 RepID=A0A8J6C9S8_DIALT|nr:hypothetical protein KFE25_008216 [Diacronema lutheri]
MADTRRRPIATLLLLTLGPVRGRRLAAPPSTSSPLSATPAAAGEFNRVFALVSKAQDCAGEFVRGPAGAGTCLLPGWWACRELGPMEGCYAGLVRTASASSCCYQVPAPQPAGAGVRMRGGHAHAPPGKQPCGTRGGAACVRAEQRALPSASPLRQPPSTAAGAAAFGLLAALALALARLRPRASAPSSAMGELL